MDPDLENTYLVLLGLAEKFRNEPYYNCMLSLKCLKAILNLPVEPEIHYSIYLKIGKILYYMYNDIEISKTYFEKSNSLHDAERLIKQCLNQTKENSLWYSIFSIELSQTYIKSNDPNKTYANFINGIEYANLHANEHTFFIYLSYSIFLLMTNNISRLEENFEKMNLCLKKIQNNLKKENMILNLLLIQILTNLIQGKGKSVKPYLKKLQQLLQNFTNDNAEGEIIWLPKQYVVLLSYILIIVHALQVGYMERALKYIDKGLTQIDTMKAELTAYNDRIISIDYSENPLSPINVLYRFECCLREYLTVSHMVTGKYGLALEEIQRCFLDDYPGIKRDKTFRQKTRLHIFLGLYSLATKEYDKSQAHFNYVRIQAPLNDPNNMSMFPYQSNEQSSYPGGAVDLIEAGILARNKLFVSFNLLLLYMHLNRNNFHNAFVSPSPNISKLTSTALGGGSASNNLNLEPEIRKLLEQQIDPDATMADEKIPYIYKSAINFIYSLWHFCKRDFNESKKYLREALKMSNAEDINRMTSFSLLLLGQIFIHSQNFQDCLTMLNPGCQLAVKIQDPCSQIWASVLYKQMYQATGNENQFKESLELSTKLSETFAKEFQETVNSQLHKKLISISFDNNNN